MLRRALKTLKHGLEHLKQGSASDRGFAFEHIDQAAELLVKEKARQFYLGAAGCIFRDRTR